MPDSSIDMRHTFQGQSILNSRREQDQHIAGLDPLGMDKELKELPGLNAGKDIRSMVGMLYRNLPIPAVLNRFDYNEAIAAMRDIGMLLGSLKRHGVEPVEAVPELDYILGELSHKTSLPGIHSFITVVGILPGKECGLIPIPKMKSI